MEIEKLERARLLPGARKAPAQGNDAETWKRTRCQLS